MEPEKKKIGDVEFSDMIISKNSYLNNGEIKSFFKGLPGNDQKIVPIPEEYNNDVKNLINIIEQTFLTKGNFRSDEGIRNFPMALSIKYEGISYRIADMNDVQNQTWFLRRMPSKMSTLQQIGFPQNYIDWILAPEQKSGLILITGAQASGKTTLASTLLTERLKLYGGHAITFEFPAEMPLQGEHGDSGFCYQTEINGEIALAAHIERAYRFANPNIIYIGEIRTKYAATEVLRMALSSSQQIVIATLHGQNIVSALERLVNWANEMDGVNGYKNLADTLLAVFHTKLELTDNSKILHIPELLLAPSGKEERISISSNIGDGKISQLQGIINSQQNRIKMADDNVVEFK